MKHPVLVRPLQPSDFPAWKPLWDGYNAFYGREGETALPEEVTQTCWRRFSDPHEPVFGLVAENEGQLLGLTHYLYHRSTSRIALTCYLQDLFTLPSARGQGVGRALIQGVYEQARSAGISRVYWQTHESNAAGRRLYDSVATHMGFIVYSHDL
jgi:GNAT superfamily N-acetyltransferase